MASARRPPPPTPRRRVDIVIDNVDAVLRSIRILTSRQVLVGIPEANADRQDVDSQASVTNALLAYIHETGSPEHNIPARPFLVPGIRRNMPRIIEALRAAAEASLEGRAEEVDRFLNLAGMLGMGGARQEISTASYPPLADSTIARRHIQRGAKTMRPGERRYFELRDNGMEPGAAQAAVGIQPLINTGQLRNAITYVVRDTNRER